MQNLKSWILPLAMLTGMIFHDFTGQLMPAAPALIFCTMFIAFCRIAPRDLHPRLLHAWLLVIQIALALLAYAAIRPFNVILAQGVMVCFLAPTAGTAPVVTGMLGGDVAFLASFSLISNTAVAFAAPAIFALIGAQGDQPFFASFLIICRQVVPLLLLPLAMAWFLRAFAPRPHAWLLRHQMISFYVWAANLTIVMGNTVNFVLTQDKSDHSTEVLLALGALTACACQFFLGKAIGGAFHDKISGGQALGQKNTVLAIWLALTYANPLGSLAPASYVLWQNLFNSWQLWRKQRSGGLARIESGPADLDG